MQGIGGGGRGAEARRFVRDSDHHAFWVENMADGPIEESFDRKTMPFFREKISILSRNYQNTSLLMFFSKIVACL